MFRKVLYVIGVLLLASGLLGASMKGTLSQVFGGDVANQGVEETCPPGYTYYAVLEPIQEGEQSSRITEQGCKPIEPSVEEVTLKPIQPGDEGWEVKPSESTERNDVVLGPSGETVYRCVFLLEPIRPGEESSRASEPVCSAGTIDSINSVSIDSSYLIAKFYDRTNYTTLLVEYYGASACSSTISYGVTALPSNLDNKFASGQSYSNCNRIYVYDFTNYGGPSYLCGANCPSFYALNDHVSSWRTTQ